MNELVFLSQPEKALDVTYPSVRYAGDALKHPSKLTPLPLQDRIESVGDVGDLEDVYETERHLLYVACTRARDRLMISGVDPQSEFLDDLNL